MASDHAQAMSDFQAGQHPAYQPLKSDGFDTDCCCSPNTDVSKKRKVLPALATQAHFRRTQRLLQLFFHFASICCINFCALVHSCACYVFCPAKTLRPKPGRDVVSIRTSEEKAEGAPPVSPSLLTIFISIVESFSEVSVTTDMFGGNIH